ncbi:glutamic acid-rich protein-like [Macadamia integrifolia]|uniref:glutamic acid-rich protein-like n=1 Tax=Macadamia integrifolia TaxID=60698 RepID=UPI001C501ADF|nr:glutamic acid-rich protein-like [Macadamia integrifolia]
MVVVSKNPRRADRLPKKKRRLDHKISASEDESILEEEGQEQEEPNILHVAEMKEFSEDESDLENEAAEDEEQEQGEEFLEDESASEYETAEDEEQEQEEGEGHGSRQDAEMEELEKEYSNLRNQQL